MTDAALEILVLVHDGMLDLSLHSLERIDMPIVLRLEVAHRAPQTGFVAPNPDVTA